MSFTADEILESLSRLDKAALLLLSENGESPVEGKTAYQKELFFIANYDEEIGDEAYFQPYYFGPYSESAETSLENLVGYGLVVSERNKYSLSSLGKLIVSVIKENSDIDSEEIADVKEFFSGMEEDEFILFTYVLHPDYTTESKIKTRVLKKRIPLSISLYNKGKVDLEMASHLSGLPMENFLDRLRVGKGEA